MKEYKIADMWISIGLIVGSVVYAFLYPDLENVVTTYFIVGGWQVISMLGHAFTKTFTYKWGARHIYHWITFISLVTLPCSCWLLVFTAPFMAVWYTWLCYHEVYVKMKRPLADLK